MKIISLIQDIIPKPHETQKGFYDNVKYTRTRFP